MEPRLDLFSGPRGAKVFKHLVAAGATTHDALSVTTRELVNIRVSQINGCGYCVDMHTKDAVAAGETSVRLNLIAAWREATVFTDAERAALQLAESGARLADGSGVSDEAWQAAAEQYDEDQLLALVAHIALINAWNRLNVITRQPAGSYRPGQFG